ncbi:MAG: carboxypeptidase-like regulatory domain-containing protein [Acidobacteriota bacterium]
MRRPAHIPALAAALLGALAGLPAVSVLAAPPAADGAPASRVTRPAASVPGIGGRVLGTKAPLAAATVYAYQLTDSSFHKVSTDADGRFLFESVPAGLYKIIAHKPGFLPGVLKVKRITAEMDQFLELRLAEMKSDFSEPASGFWAARAGVPSDILREIEIATIAAETRRAAREGAAAFQVASALPPRFETRMAVRSGVDEIAAGGDSQVMGGQVDIAGRVGEMRLGLAGDFMQLEPTAVSASEAGSSTVGEMSALSLVMSSGEGMRVAVTSRNNRMEGDGLPVDLEHYRVSVSSDIGDKGRSNVTAGYTSESNFHRQGWTDPISVPDASRSWHLAGFYETDLTERSTLHTGVRYRELEANSLSVDGRLGTAPAFAHERFDVFGLGSQRFMPTLLVKYGIYASMVNGAMSLIPQGGVVVQLAPAWQASALISQKVDDGGTQPEVLGFVPTYFGETGGCDQNLQSCYQLTVSHLKNDDETLSLGAVHREYDEIEKLYFDEDFFNRFESLYLVPGDELPEVQFAISRRLSPNILTRLESSVAQGGGGVFQAGNETSWENDVEYVVTSLDTQFQATATGVYLAFHQLRQNLEAISASQLSNAEAYEVERLQVRLTQDLNFLRALAADWALNLNMELSRGTSPYVTAQQEDDVRKRLLGGIAVSF